MEIKLNAFRWSTIPQKQFINSAGDINHRKTHKSKSFSVIQKILKFDSHGYAPL